jgi:hypothetical protein
MTSAEMLRNLVDNYASDLVALREGTWERDYAIAPDDPDDFDTFEQWMHETDVMETVVITRTSLGHDDRGHVSAVEMLVAFGGPNVRITFHEHGDATVSGAWGTDREERTVYMGDMDVVERFAEMWEASR